MPRRKAAAAAEAVQAPATEIPAPIAEAASAAPVTSPEPKPAARDEAEKPFVFKTVNAGGTKIHLQHSQKHKEFQIRFGGGGEQDKPSDAVRDYLKSHRKAIVTKDGQEKDVQLFQWNNEDRAWGMRIPYDWKAKDEVNHRIREDARDNAKAIFDQVVKLTEKEREGLGSLGCPAKGQEAVPWLPLRFMGTW